MKPTWILGLLAVMLPFLAPANESTLMGEAYSLDGNTLLYREFHTYQFEDGKPQSANVVYRRPDGTVIGRKTLDYSVNPYVPAFRTELYDGKFVEGLRYDDGDIVMFRRKGLDGKEKTKTLTPDGSMAADAGFHNYLQFRFDELMTGDEVQFRFVAPSQLAAVKFDAQKVGEGTVENVDVVNFRVEISSFISMFIDPLLLSYDPTTKNLIEYRGLSNVRDEDGELYNVRIRYPELIRTAARQP